MNTPRLSPLAVALPVFLASGSLPAAAQMRAPAAGDAGVVSAAAEIGGSRMPTVGALQSALPVIGVNAALAAPSVALSPLVSGAPAAVAAAPSPLAGVVQAALPTRMDEAAAKPAAVPGQNSAAGRFHDTVLGGVRGGFLSAASVSFDGEAVKPAAANSPADDAAATPVAPAGFHHVFDGWRAVSADIDRMDADIDRMDATTWSLAEEAVGRTVDQFYANVAAKLTFDEFLRLSVYGDRDSQYRRILHFVGLNGKLLTPWEMRALASGPFNWQGRALIEAYGAAQASRLSVAEFQELLVGVDEMNEYHSTPKVDRLAPGLLIDPRSDSDGRSYGRADTALRMADRYVGAAAARISPAEIVALAPLIGYDSKDYRDRGNYLWQTNYLIEKYYREAKTRLTRADVQVLLDGLVKNSSAIFSRVDTERRILRDWESSRSVGDGEAKPALGE